MFFIDRRKYPRYCCRLPAFLNDREMHVYLCDLSLSGCFIEAPPELLIPKGEKVSLTLMLPCVGPLPVTGIVRHHGTAERLGMGIEFLEFPDRLHLVYAKFVKILPLLEEARNLYQKLAG
ncbi:MAG TPA: PilZ domain-containing protein [Thermodesulfatator atlanticus]|uniref:PilZ domain-containing protein n=1 Tax=Thermodesulfatator atlanticus TaxID=501497 RepID=A0A7V5P169_9BACT|nr:PilZ domain-containing protein [Thermodesulfatator atlanticus]